MTDEFQIKKDAQVEIELSEFKKLYRTLFSQSPDAVVILDPETTLPFEFNDKINEILGYTREEFAKLRIADYEAIESSEEVRLHIDKILREGKDEFETRMRTKTGEIRNIIVSINVIELLGKRFFHNIFRDITDIKRAEEKFKVIFDNATDGILLADVESKKFHEANKNICQMTGYGLEEIKNMGVLDIHPEEDMAYVINQFERQARGEFTLAKDIPVKRKDGTVFYADINSRPITLAGKTYLIGIFRDVTERKQAEGEIRKSKEYIEKLNNALADAIFIVKLPERKIEYANAAVERIFGYSVEECVGQATSIFYRSEDEFLDFGRRLKSVIEQGRDILHVEQLLKRKTGEFFLSEITITFLKEEDRVVRVISIVRDITENKKAEIEIKKRVKELEDFYEMAVGRELRMKELKEKIKKLEAELAKYKKDID